MRCTRRGCLVRDSVTDDTSPRRWLFVLDKAMTPCADKNQVIDIGSANRNNWQLLPGTALHADCVAKTHGVVAGGEGALESDGD